MLKRNSVVQKFINDNCGGVKGIIILYKRFNSASKIAKFIFDNYNFYVCSNTIRNMLKKNGHKDLLKLNIGGDRKSTLYNQKRTE
jgi:hypothetical protein